jgi:DnaK suppressor protein
MTVYNAPTHLPPHLPADAIPMLRSLLLCQLAEDVEQIAERQATADDLTGQSDQDSLLERELAQAAVAHHTAAAQDARDALARLDEGTYGICEVCAAPIPFERLEVIPHARRCVACPEA